MNSDNDLDKQLNNWRTEFSPDPLLEQRIRQRLTPKSKKQHPLLHFLTRPIYAGIAAAAMLVLGIAISNNWHTRTVDGLEKRIALYRSSIDPINRLSSPTHEASRDLLWLETTLKMGKPQSQNFNTLHRVYQDSFNDLFQKLNTLKQNYDNIDALGKTENVVDFLKLYALLQQQEKIRKQSLRMTDELLKKAATILDAEQQKQFRALIEKELPPTPPITL